MSISITLNPITGEFDLVGSNDIIIDEYASASAFPEPGKLNVLYIALDTKKMYIWTGSAYVESSPSEVTSVNGQTGAVTLTKSDVGLSNVDNTSDATKNSASATLTNKTIDATSNTISNISNTEIKSGANIALNKLAPTTASKALVSDASGVISPSSVTSTELGYVSGVTSNVQDQLDDKLNLSGGTMSGPIHMGGSDIDQVSKVYASELHASTKVESNYVFANEVFTNYLGTNGGSSVILWQGINANSHKIENLDTPTNSSDATTKAYVDALVNGATWLNPINDPDLVNDSLSAPPGILPTDYEIYIVGASPSGAWASLAGHAVYYNTTTSTWIDLLGRAVQAGDRFGISMEYAGTAGGGLTGKDNQIAQIVSPTPGAITYTFTAPINGQAVFVANELSSHFGHSYNYNGTQWIEFGGPGAINAGTALDWSGNTLNVNLGAGINGLISDAVSIDLYSTSGMDLVDPSTGSPSTAANSQLSLKLDGSTLSKSGSGVKLSDSVQTDINNKLPLSGGTMSGPIDMSNNSIISVDKLGIGISNPSTPFHIQKNGAGSFVDLMVKNTDSSTADANQSRIRLTTYGDSSDGVVFGKTVFGGPYQGNAYFWNTENSAFMFATSNAEKMRLDASGNLGIGTASPSTKLDVNGNAKIAGQLDMNSHRVVNVSDAVNSTDAVNLGQLNTKEPAITAGTASQYYRGDKTFQTLDKSTVGLSNVDNTSDATKNSAIATLTNKTIDASYNAITNLTNANISSAAAIDRSKLASLSPSMALTSNASGVISSSSVTSTELGYLSGVTSSIQTQLSGKEPTITAGSTSQYYRGDKTFQTLDKSAVGLSNVDNTSDATKNSAVATLTNKDFDGGTASNTNRITLPKNTKANLDALTRKQATLAYETDTNKLYVDTGTAFSEVGLNGTPNYIKNSQAETSTGGYSQYQNYGTSFNASAVSVAANTITITGHSFVNGQKVYLDPYSGTLPAPLVAGTTYYIINTTTNTIQLSTTLGGSVIDITTAGNGDSVIGAIYPTTTMTAAATITVARSTTNPLSGAASFLFQKAVTSLITAGGGLSYDFTIDNSSKAKVLNISFDYIVTSGTFTAGTSTTDSDMVVWILDKTNNVLIQPTNYKLFSNSTTNSFQFTGQFQTASNSASYSLLLHNINTSYVAYELKFDNVQVTPSNYTYGTPVTDWQTFTATAGASGTLRGTTTAPTFGTIVTNNAKWRRVGKNMELQWDFHQSTAGTAGSGNYLIDISQLGVSIDTTLEKANTSFVAYTDFSDSNLGVFNLKDSGGTGIGIACVYSATQIKLVMQYCTTAGVSSAGSWGSTYGQLSVATLGFNVNLTIPIVGWSSNVQMSDQSYSNVIAANVGNSSYSTTTGTSATKVPFSTISYDSSGSAAATGDYIIPVAGIYSISPNIQINSSATNVTVSCAIYVNGSQVKSWSLASSYSHLATGTYILNLKAGDIVTFSAWNDTGTYSGVFTAQIQRLSGPTSIAATETVMASYYLSANFATSTTTPVNFDTRIIDTHGCVSTSASAWKFTSPTSGFYAIGTFLSIPSAGITTYNRLYKNGVFNRSLGYLANTAGFATMPTTYDVIYLNAGDYIDFRTNTTVTVGGGALAGDVTSHVTITKIGI